MTWKRFHFLWIFSHWKRLLKIFKCEKNHKWKFSSVEPLAHATGNEKFFKCKQLHECHAHVSVFFSFFLSFVKKITLKALTIVKYFTQFLSISKLFRNVSVYSLVFVWYCEGFHKVPRKMLWPYNYGSGASCKRFQEIFHKCKRLQMKAFTFVKNCTMKKIHLWKIEHMNTCSYVHVFIHEYLFICSYVHMLICSCIHVSIFIVNYFTYEYLLICSCIHMFICSCIHMFICSCIHMFICSYVHVFM